MNNYANKITNCTVIVSLHHVHTVGQNTSSNTMATAADTDNSSAIIGGAVGGTALLIVLIILCIVIQRIMHSYKKKRGYSTGNAGFTHASVSIGNPNFDRKSNPYVFELTNMKTNNLEVDLGVEARVGKGLYVNCILNELIAIICIHNLKPYTL